MMCYFKYPGIWAGVVLALLPASCLWVFAMDTNTQMDWGALCLITVFFNGVLQGPVAIILALVWAIVRFLHHTPNRAWEYPVGLITTTSLLFLLGTGFCRSGAV